jgi:2-oxoglutarate ferredoxin oxidoreductase subunit alpha
MIRAFNLAEKYRNPVIVMSDTTIALMREKVVIPSSDDIVLVDRAKPQVPPDEFLPFAAEPDGVPPLPDFGEGYRILHSLNPHDEKGDIHWDPDVFEALYERITRKITAHYEDIVQTESFYLDGARVGVIAYGSECRPALAAVKQARADGVRAGLLKLKTIWPVPEREITALAGQCSRVFAVEMNVGKYAREIERVVAGRCPVHRVTKNRGMIHTTEEILEAIGR